MNKKTTKTMLGIALISALAGTALTACVPASDVASKNISDKADNFEVQRRIVFFNGITDKYLLTIEGKCSITPDGGKLDVTCRIGPDEYKKHFLGLSDNVTYFVEQLDPVDVSVYHTVVRFKPEQIVPDLRMDVGKQ